MKTYSVWALIKCFIWLLIVILLYKYVNVYESPILWLVFGFLWLFMMIWGLSYFLFLWFYRALSHAELADQSSYSYKLSLRCALCIMVNLTLMINNSRSNTFWILSILAFMSLIPVISHGQWTPENASDLSDLAIDAEFFNEHVTHQSDDTSGQ